MACELQEQFIAPRNKQARFVPAASRGVRFIPPKISDFAPFLPVRKWAARVFICWRSGKRLDGNSLANRICKKKRLSFAPLFLNFDTNGTLWC
jgi:hypothetical protein